MKLILFAAALALSAQDAKIPGIKTGVTSNPTHAEAAPSPVPEKLTPLDRAQIAAADTKIALAESEYQTRLLQKNALISQICERADAPLNKCSIDMQSGVIAKKPQEKTK